MVEGCDKSAQSSTNFCVKHGGGKKCQFEDCEKVARGKTLFCAAVSYVMTMLVILGDPFLTIFHLSMAAASDANWRDVTELPSGKLSYVELTAVEHPNKPLNSCILQCN
jgi:hypothetical protein